MTYGVMGLPGIPSQCKVQILSVLISYKNHHMLAANQIVVLLTPQMQHCFMNNSIASQM